MKASIVVSVAIVDDGRLLLVQEGKEICYGQWSLPGGRVEPGEGLIAAAEREVLEETGYRIRVTGMTRVVRYISQNGFHCVRFNFVAGLLGGDPAVDGAEILAMRWMGFDEIDLMEDAELRTPAIARAVMRDVREGKVYGTEIVLDALTNAE